MDKTVRKWTPLLRENYWREVIARYEQRTVSASAFAATERVSTASIADWRARFQREGLRTSKRSPPAPLPPLLAVAVAPAAPAARFELVFPSGVVLRCHDAIEPTTLAAMLTVLR